MANLTPTPAWPSVYQLEKTDRVLGGPGGIANQQAQQLLDRTEFIRTRGASMPWDKDTVYAEGAVTLKDGELSMLSGGVWSPLGGNIKLIDTVADMKAIKNPKDGDTVFVRGYRKPTNMALARPYRGGGMFVFNDKKKSTDNGGDTIAGWERPYSTTHTPEEWGAYGDGVNFDDGYINNMFKSLCPYPTGGSCKISDIRNTLDYCKLFTVRLENLYRTKKTVYVPCGFTIRQGIVGRWTQTPGVGIDYEPDNKDFNLPAVATIAYMFNNDASTVQEGTYSQVTDIMFAPKAEDFDSAKFITLGWHVDFEGLMVTTNPGVTLGVFFNGFFGKTDGLTVGSSLGGRVPKVGVVTNIGWNAEHRFMGVSSSVQGVVFHGVCTWNTLINPLINRRGDAVRTTDTIPVYMNGQINTPGTIAITNISSITHVITPCYQSWVISVANVSKSIYTAKVSGAYNESTVCKHEYYNIESSLDVEISGYLGGYFYEDTFRDLDGSSVTYRRSGLYVDNMGDGSKYRCSFRGDARFGVWRWLSGHSSRNVNCVDMHVSNIDSAGTWGKIGDIHLLSEFKTDVYRTVYIKPSSGDDENFGFKENRPLKTLAPLTKWNLLGVNRVVFLEDSASGVGDRGVDIHRDCTFSGGKLITEFARFIAYGDISLDFQCDISGVGNPYAIIYLTEGAKVFARFTGRVVVDGTAARAIGNSFLDIEAVSNEFRVARYVDAADGKYCSLGVVQKYPQAQPEIGYGDVFLRYKTPSDV